MWLAVKSSSDSWPWDASILGIRTILDIKITTLFRTLQPSKYSLGNTAILFFDKVSCVSVRLIKLSEGGTSRSESLMDKILRHPKPLNAWPWTYRSGLWWIYIAWKPWFFFHQSNPKDVDIQLPYVWICAAVDEPRVASFRWSWTLFFV